MKRKVKNILFLYLGVTLNISSFVVVLSDNDFTNSKVAFLAWLFSLLFIGIFFVRIKSLVKLKSHFKDKYLIFLILFSILCSFLFISIYPFNSVGDEMREGGRDSMRIATSSNVNLFGYDQYTSHGEIIPAYISLYYPLFGHSTEAFRVPIAVISVITIMAFYLLTLHQTKNRNISFISSLVLLCSPYYLYYARTNLVAFSSIPAAILLFFTFLWIYNKSDINRNFIAGLLIGFCFTLYVSIKPYAIFTLFLILLLNLRRDFKKQPLSLIKKTAVLFSGILMGFGPYIIHTTPEIFFHTEKFNTDSKSLFDLLFKYFNSILLLFGKNLDSYFFSYLRPILSYLEFTFLIVGIYFSIKKKIFYGILALIIILFLLFSNNAITSGLNLDYRIILILPFLAILIATGVVSLQHKIVSKNLKRLSKLILIMLIFSSLAINLYNFFYLEPASYPKFQDLNGRIYMEYLMTNSIKLINSEFKNNTEICITSSTLNKTTYFDYAHVLEQYDYFLPDKSITFEADPEVKENEIYISTNCKEAVKSEWLTHEVCGVYSKYICPPDYSKGIIYFSK